MSKSNGNIVDVLDQVIGVPTSRSEPSASSSFIPSAKFAGSKPNYVFRAGEKGTGYYLDTPPSGNEPEPKRPRLDNEAASTTNNEQNKRSVRFDSSQDTTKSIPARPPKLTGEQLLAQAEAELTSTNSHLQKHFLDPPTSKSIQSSAASLQKTYDKNQLLRAQHSDNPEKFMDNELALHDEIVAFKNTAVDVNSYEYLVRHGVMEVFGRLLEHENSDVAMSVVSVLVELLDSSLLEEEEGENNNDGGANSSEMREQKIYNVGMLANAFLAGGGLDALSNNLGRFDESIEEDAKGIEDTLTLLESLLDFDQKGMISLNTESQASSDSQEDEPTASVVASICKTPLLSWLLNRIEKSDETNDAEAASSSAPISPAVIRLHASEVLATILQHEDYSINRCGTRLTSCPEYTCVFDDSEEDQKPHATTNDREDKEDTKRVDGMEILLVAIAAYRKSDPKVEVECEFLENIFDALAASLLRPDNVSDFVEKEGIQLMLRCIREKVHSGGGALKVINFALSGSSAAASAPSENSTYNPSEVYRNACEVFVQAGGLKLLFPLFMARKSAIPCPAACSEGGSDLAKKAMTNKTDRNGVALSKRAKRAAHARKKWLAEVEQNVINIMYSLTRYVDGESKYDSYSRLLAKFVEEECEKCDRIIELCLKYDEKARIAEYQFFKSDEAEDAEELGLDIDVAALSAKLRGGGDIFHRLCAILSFVCVGSTRGHGHVREQLKLKGTSISVIKEGLTEFASLLVAGSQKDQIEHYLSNI